MDIIISFDSEDIVTPEAADAEKFWADELTSRDIRASYQCVGEMIRCLKKWDREDVIQAIDKHEIGYHTNYHSLHPIHPEATENLTLQEGIEWMYQREMSGFQTVVETFKRVPISYTPSGDSWTPATLLAYASLGIKVFTCSPFPRTSNHPVWYSGLLTVFYDLFIDPLYEGDEVELETLQQQYLDYLEKNGEDAFLIMPSHPCRLVTTRFWDVPLKDGVHVPLEKLPPAPLRSPTQIEKGKDLVKRFLDWLQSRPEVQFKTYSDLYQKYSKERRDLQVLLDEKQLLHTELHRLTETTDRKSGYLKTEDVDQFDYEWIIHPPGFKGENLKEMARNLLWTSSKAISI